MIDLSPLVGEPDADDGLELTFRVFPKTGRERWMLEMQYSKPWHLKTWPRVNLRARLIYAVAQVLSWIGLSLPHRKITIPVAPDAPYWKLRQEFVRLGIFLGTPGPNRKFVVFAGKGRDEVFVKIPLSSTSAALVDNEAEAIAQLSADPNLSRLLPQARRVAGHLAVENMELRGGGFRKLSTEAVVHVHDLLYARSRISCSLVKVRASVLAEEEASGWKDSLVDHSPAHRALIDSCRSSAEGFIGKLSPYLEVDCYEAHGDLTPWNVLATRHGDARIIDWELFGLKPRYFDLVHYFAAADILLKHAAPKEIIAHLDAVGAGRDQWRLYVGLYVVLQALYHCMIYDRQPDLHVQAIWQMETWRGMIELLDTMQPPSLSHSTEILNSSPN